MALVYAALGVVTASLGKTFGRFTYSPWTYGAVGLLIILFGVLMLDVLTVPVPRFFTGVQTAGVRKGGYGGALLIGLAAGFVAAPCTAPVLGLLLVYVAKTRVSQLCDASTLQPYRRGRADRSPHLCHCLWLHVARLGHVRAVVCRDRVWHYGWLPSLDGTPEL